MIFRIKLHFFFSALSCCTIIAFSYKSGPTAAILSFFLRMSDVCPGLALPWISMKNTPFDSKFCELKSLHSTFSISCLVAALRASQYCVIFEHHFAASSRLASDKSGPKTMPYCRAQNSAQYRVVDRPHPTPGWAWRLFRIVPAGHFGLSQKIEKRSNEGHKP